MTARPYNGFTPDERHHASRAARLAREAGKLPPLPPMKCMACGQTEGRIEPHSEDYSTPIGPHLGAYVWCFFCHRMLHNRFWAPDAWDRYRAALRKGATFAPVFTNTYVEVNRFCRGGHHDYTEGAPRPTLYFDTMELSSSPERPPSYLLAKLEAMRGRPLIIEPPKGQLGLF